MTISVENPEKVGEKCLPNSKLEFVKKVRGKEAIKVKVKRVKPRGELREGILFETVSMFEYDLKNIKTYASRDCRFWTQNPVYIYACNRNPLLKQQFPNNLNIKPTCFIVHSQKF